MPHIGLRNLADQDLSVSGGDGGSDGGDGGGGDGGGGDGVVVWWWCTSVGLERSSGNKKHFIFP